MPLGKFLETEPTGFPEVALVKTDKSPYWLVRIYRGNQRYSHRSTQTTDLKRAQGLVGEIYGAFLRNPDEKRPEDRETTVVLLDQWVEYEKDRWKKREIERNTYESRNTTATTGIAPYLMEKGLLRKSDLNPRKDFKDYPGWRVAKGYKRSTVTLELKHIKQWVGWLHKKGYVKDPTVDAHVPRQTHRAAAEEDGQAKAFTNDQFEDIVGMFEHLMNTSKGFEKVKWQQVWAFFCLMFDGGFRTDELWHLTFGQCKCRKTRFVGDYETECLVDVQISKTGPRETIFMSNMIGYLRELYEQKGLKVTGSTPLWANPLTGQKWSKQFFTNRFRKKVLDPLGIIGDEYRLYSCRSTHITDKIENGVSTYLLAKNVGTSETMIRQEYEDVLMRLQTRELFKRTKGEEDSTEFAPIA